MIDKFKKYASEEVLTRGGTTKQYYLEKDIAVIYKKPTPIGINKVRYENNKQIIKEAYFKTQSTLDYNGIYKGYYVDFDAKETTSKTAFPLSNIHEHQLEHIKRVDRHGGLSFLIIKMNNAYYTLGAKKIMIESQYLFLILRNMVLK